MVTVTYIEDMWRLYTWPLSGKRMMK